MSADPDRQQRYDRNGRWLPPRELGANKLSQSPFHHIWYHYDGRQTTVVPQPTVPMQHYNTYSLYIINHKIWIYPYDATVAKVGNGTTNPDAESEPGNSSDEEGARPPSIAAEDWTPLRFQWPNTDNVGSPTFVARRALESTLQCQRSDQRWVREILPIRYHAEAGYRAEPQGRGGLVGELPILIALIALSVRPDQVPTALVHCMGHEYNPHGLPRGQGCTCAL